MTIRIKNDRIEFTANGSSNTYTLRETANGFNFNGVIQASNIIEDGFQGTVAGFSMAGIAPPGSTTIDRYPFATDENGVRAGDLTSATYYSSGLSSRTHGYVAGSYVSGNVIRKFSFASPAAASQFGSLTSPRGISGSEGQSSSTHGYVAGGSPPFPSGSNVIDKFSFAIDAAATDVGDLVNGRYGPFGHSSTTSGYSSGGQNPGYLTSINKFPFATDTNATSVGSLTQARGYSGAQSSTTHGYNGGGLLPGSPAYSNTIDKFPFSTDTNATDVGDLTQARGISSGSSSTSFGYVAGGTTGSLVNTIDKFPFSADSNATDVGDLGRLLSGSSGAQD